MPVCLYDCLPECLNARLLLITVRYGYQAEAVAIANNVVAILAQDLNATGTWHECYDAGTVLPKMLIWYRAGIMLAPGSLHPCTPPGPFDALRLCCGPDVRMCDQRLGLAWPPRVF
jgi:hypothetical protein